MNPKATPVAKRQAEGLHDRMRRLAVTHPRKDELLAVAGEFEKAARGFYGDPQTVDAKKFVGTWARAKRLWCECTGEPIVSKAVSEAGARLMKVLTDARKV